MNKEKPNLEKPKTENATIWRYMDFTKFVDLLDKKSLFFSRTDKLGDPFEGSCPIKSIKTRSEIYGSKYVGDFFKLLREFTTVNCWYLSRYESAAMWKLYLKSDEGIAIKSSYRRLRDSLKNSEFDIFIGKVKYINYDEEEIPINFLSPFFHKRMSFRHERELRACIQKLPKKGFSERSKRPFENGVYVEVDLKVLIRGIYLAPKTPKWLVELIESVTKKYKLEKNVVHSSLDTTPIY